MIITPIRTKKIVTGDSLQQIFSQSLPKLTEQTVIVITSKIVSITSGDTAPASVNKEELIRNQADMYFYDSSLPQEERFMLTIKDSVITPWAGIDESNSNGNYILLPKDAMQKAAQIWDFLRQAYGLKHLGVIIADSTFIPLRTGSISVGIGWCGFEPIKNYIGTPDVFGRKLEYTTTSFVDGIAIAAGMVMGEGNEQQPVALVNDLANIHFIERKPSNEEIASMQYPMDKGLFGPLMKAVAWEKSK